MAVMFANGVRNGDAVAQEASQIVDHCGIVSGFDGFDGFDGFHGFDRFHEHRDEYEAHCRGPLIAIVEQLAKDFRSFAPEMLADPKVSRFRPFRDTRFSEDKTPLKTNVCKCLNEPLIAARKTDRKAHILDHHSSPLPGRI